MLHFGPGLQANYWAQRMLGIITSLLAALPQGIIKRVGSSQQYEAKFNKDMMRKICAFPYAYTSTLKHFAEDLSNSCLFQIGPQKNCLKVRTFVRDLTH